jgi:hypothetical protein
MADLGCGRFALPRQLRQLGAFCLGKTSDVLFVHDTPRLRARSALRRNHHCLTSKNKADKALEALWKLDSELSFRLAFRTSSLLGTSDDLREQVFETLRTYYGIRSKIVHGTMLRASESELVQNDEPLREIVRKTLRAFIHLLANPGEWTIGRLARDPDTVLLHSEKRSALQRAMAVLPLGAP